MQAQFSKYKSIARITEGHITNNHMAGSGKTNFAFGGGGIYVNGYNDQTDVFSNGQVFIENVLVTDNYAAYQGGGYAACPVSNTRIYVTDGVALYGNSAQEALADDLFILSAFAGWGAHGGNPDFIISPLMLGGLPYQWKNVGDGTEIPLDELVGILTGEGNILHLYTDAVASSYTESLAKVFINNNTSQTRGGGIGSNGDVTFGSPESEVISITANKVWDDDNDANGFRPDQIVLEVWFKTEGSGLVS